MNVQTTGLDGVRVITPAMHRDARGAFAELWHLERYRSHGIPSDWVQDNFSSSTNRAVRGLHFQQPFFQEKLLTVLEGTIYDVVVDVRYGSPTFGQHIAVTLTALSASQIYIPNGFAHGFQVTSSSATVHYKCSTPYMPAAERTLLWNDADIGVTWPLSDPIVSSKDALGMALREFDRASLPLYEK